MKKLLIFSVIIIVLGIITVPKVIEKINAPEVAEEVNVIAVGGMAMLSGDMVSEVALIGTTMPSETVNVMVAVPAKVQEVKVAVGDYVKEGDVLFILNGDSVEDQITQASIGLTMAKVGVKNAKAGVNQASLAYSMAKSNYKIQLDNYEFGKNNLNNYQALFEEGLVSKTELDQVKLQASEETVTLLESQLSQASSALSQAKLGVESATASLEQAQEGYKSATDMLEDMTVTAPVSGFITTSYVTENNFASNAQPAMVIQDMDQITVSANVTESLVSTMAPGDKVTVTIDALEDKGFQGTIDTLSTSADQRTLLFPLTVKVANENHSIKPGMFAVVKVVKAKSNDTLYVPGEAVILRDDVHYLYLLSGENQVARVPVEVGIDNGYFTEILSGATKEDIVITNGMGLIDESSTIKVIRSDQ